MINHDKCYIETSLLEMIWKHLLAIEKGAALIHEMLQLLWIYFVHDDDWNIRPLVENLCSAKIISIELTDSLVQWNKNSTSICSKVSFKILESS